MDVDFIAEDPQRKSRPILETVLSRGVDQLAIACAFCTRAGVEILSAHVTRLKKVDSFVVVAVAPPTDYAALGRLHLQIPNNLFVHWGKLSPVEVKVGAALMHSKVFYARTGNECWLWTGSHNLTGNATQGGNCEAAILLHGCADEKPFVDALRHLTACRDEATLYDPNTPPPGTAQRDDTLVIHAEADAIPTLTLPWRIHLRLDSPEFDDLLGPPANARLFLYARGALKGGWQAATPIAAFSGALTGQNLTARNPRASRAGTPAEWSSANFSISDLGGTLVLGPDGPVGPLVTTQAVLYFDAPSNPRESLFSEEPRVEQRPILGERSLTGVDRDMRRFFKKRSVQGEMLVHIPIVGRRFVVKVPGEEARQSDFDKIRDEVARDMDIPYEVIDMPESSAMRRHPFILRAKFRLHGD